MIRKIKIIKIIMCGDSIVNRSLIVMCVYIVNKSANGLGGKNRGIVYREKIPQFVYRQLSFKSCPIKTYSSDPVSQ